MPLSAHLFLPSPVLIQANAGFSVLRCQSLQSPRAGPLPPAQETRLVRCSILSLLARCWPLALLFSRRFTAQMGTVDLHVAVRLVHRIALVHGLHQLLSYREPLGTVATRWR